jgi:Ca2+-binding EF-hand superfamily protein
MNKLLTGGALAAFALAATPVAAQPAPPPPPGVAQGTAPMPMPAPHTPPVVRSPAQVRVMSDRVMTRDEVVQHVRRMFADLDTNHDGYVTRNEVAALHDRMMTGMHAAIAVSRAEHAMPGGGHEMAMADPARMFDRLDTNHDGVISRQEFMSAHARMHERRVVIMRNENVMGGPADMGPMRVHMRRMGGEAHGMGFAARLFDMADANHDGRVSLQEAEAAALAHFDRADLNHDGRITPDERAQAHRMMRERRPG